MARKKTPHELAMEALPLMVKNLDKMSTEWLRDRIRQNNELIARVGEHDDPAVKMVVMMLELELASRGFVVA
jgi:hypothetical protein